MQETPVERLMPALVARLKAGSRPPRPRGRRRAGQRPDLRRRGLRRLPHDDGPGPGLPHEPRPARGTGGPCPCSRSSIATPAGSASTAAPTRRSSARSSRPRACPTGPTGGRGPPRRRPRQGHGPGGGHLRLPGPGRRRLGVQRPAPAVQDNTEVHRTVLPYRAWDLLGLIGPDHAHTLLRQSVRYCVKSEREWQHTREIDRPRELLPRLMDQYKLPVASTGRPRGRRRLGRPDGPDDLRGVARPGRRGRRRRARRGDRPRRRSARRSRWPPTSSSSATPAGPRATPSPASRSAASTATRSASTPATRPTPGGTWPWPPTPGTPPPA